jgi:putative membrane protein
MQTLIQGGLAGLVATIPMTAVIAGGRAAGWLRTPPPVEITENVAENVGENPERDSPEFQAAWLAAHFGYGAACGAAYAAVRPALPFPAAVSGLFFGGAVWGVSYLGLLPALRLFPPATEDSPRRQAVMIAAHAVFGLSLAGIEHALRAGEPAGTTP